MFIVLLVSFALDSLNWYCQLIPHYTIDLFTFANEEVIIIWYSSFTVKGNDTQAGGKFICTVWIKHQSIQFHHAISSINVSMRFIILMINNTMKVITRTSIPSSYIHLHTTYHVSHTCGTTMTVKCNMKLRLNGAKNQANVWYVILPGGLFSVKWRRGHPIYSH